MEQIYTTNPIKYINRRNEAHYFSAIKTKHGKFRYSTVKKPEGKTNLITEIPQGFEIYEHTVDAKVVLRKILPTIIKEEHIKIVEDAIKKYGNVRDFLVKADKNIITIWVSHFENALEDNSEENDIIELIRMHDANPDDIKTYNDYMSFVLDDAEKNLWQCYRMTYIFEFDYVMLEKSNDLKKLAKKYCKHLGRESFLRDLVPIGWEE